MVCINKSRVNHESQPPWPTAAQLANQWDSRLLYIGVAAAHK